MAATLDCHGSDHKYDVISSLEHLENENAQLMVSFSAKVTV